MPHHTADLCDAYPDQVRVLAPLFTHYGGRHVFHGPVETILAYEDNSRVREALSEPGEGRVLVIDGGASLRRSMVGGDLAKLAVKNGWSGVLVHGAVRDVHELEQEPLGVLALGRVPRKTEKRGLGTRGISVSFAGGTFSPGNWLYADRDGVVVSAGELG
ncbi:MAG: regulator of ribonuclease activity A [Oceanicaulis sp. HLUCCA04]|nr:MAG: regulator of ribonuclease activity A [Oceanicaulis sp. HLUCCA04]